MARPEIPQTNIPTDKFGWYVVKIKNHRPKDWPDDRLAPWLREYCPGKWKYYINAISFQDIGDAMHFKLTWVD